MDSMFILKVEEKGKPVSFIEYTYRYEMEREKKIFEDDGIKTTVYVKGGDLNSKPRRGVTRP